MDEIIKWTGWLIAIVLAIWKVADYLRNRPAIKFFIGMSKEENLINLTVINTGRRPVNLIRAGVQFSDGYDEDMPQNLDIYFGWLYNMLPKINHLNLKVIKEFVKRLVNESANTIAPKYMYYSAESGDKYRVKIPNYIISELLN